MGVDAARGPAPGDQDITSLPFVPAKAGTQVRVGDAKMCSLLVRPGCPTGVGHERSLSQRPSRTPLSVSPPQGGRGPIRRALPYGAGLLASLPHPGPRPDLRSTASRLASENGEARGGLPSARKIVVPLSGGGLILMGIFSREGSCRDRTVTGRGAAPAPRGTSDQRGPGGACFSSPAGITTGCGHRPP